ncbi:MAG: hypothetical protein WCO78_03800 [Candidatus Roizmanbacteria bacterium]
MFKYLGSLSKRLRILIASSVATGMFAIAITLPYHLIPVISIISAVIIYAVVWYALYEDVKGREWYMLFIVPVVWTIVWYVFFFLIPVRWVTRLGAVSIYAFVLYVSLSANNIFNVAKTKSIQLVRVANAVNHIVHIATLYLFLQIIYAFELNWFFLLISSFVYMTFMYTQFYWAQHLSTQVRSDTPYQSPSVLTSITATFLISLNSFIPMYSVPLRAALIAGFVYLLTGVLTVHIQKKVFAAYLREYIIVLVILICMLLFAIQWAP